MKTFFVELRAPDPPATPKDDPSSKKISLEHIGEAPFDVPSPAVLAHAGAAQAAGHDVELRRVSAAAVESAELPPADADETQIHCPAYFRGAAEALAARIGGKTCRIVDASEAVEAPPAYALLAGAATVQAEAATLPVPDPVHPWTFPARTWGTPADSEERLKAAAASLRGNYEADLYVNDDRIPVDMDRLRFFAKLITDEIEQHKTLLRLHMRAWPKDLHDDRLLDHMTLLSVASLDVLAGSLHDPALTQRKAGWTAADVVTCAEALDRSGMSHVSRLNVVLGLPGETPDDCINGLNRLISLAAKHRIPRVRLSFWQGEGGALPVDPQDQRRRFLAANPAWGPIEYRGVHDFLAIMGEANKQVKIIGPGLFGGWDAPMPDVPV